MRIKLSFSLFFLFSVLVFSQSTVLVDFGENVSSNIFGLSGWDIVLKSINTNYSSSGPAGLRVVSDFEEYTDYFGIKGTLRNFKYGERIAVTWFNDSDHEIHFIPRISFIDSDQPQSGIDGNWFTKRNFDNYREAMLSIGPNSSKKSVFNVSNSGVNATAGEHLLVNINLHIEWDNYFEKQFLICDKIELLSDADTTSPSKPINLSTANITDNSVQLNWDPGVDNVGVYDYLIYLNGKVEGYSRTNSFKVRFLEPSKNYSFSVSALDIIRNESPKSDPVNIMTSSFQGRNNLIRPTDFQYLGAFKFPIGWEYGGEALAYYPNGDSSGAAQFTTDDFPGSLFCTNIDQSEHCFTGEVSIPSPVISPSHNLDELNTAINLQPFTNIRPSSISNWSDVDVWRTGLAYLSPRGSQTSAKLYHSWGFHFQVTASKSPSICWCNPQNLSDSLSFAGPWYVGNSSSQPLDTRLNDYLFSVPQTWADTFVHGRSLITGRFRDGGLSGLGPTLFALAPWQAGNPPAIFNELNFTTLLEYGDVQYADEFTFPNSIHDYNHADEWKGADWVATNNRLALLLIGKNAHGSNWYGYQGENTPLSWIEWNIPFPDFSSTDPDGKGWRSHSYNPMIILFDPNELASVANGTNQPYDPQPYAVLRLDTSLFFGGSRSIRSASFNLQNRLLYVTEAMLPGDGTLIGHIWRVYDSFTGISGQMILPQETSLFQNYPNPFNPSTKISWQSPVGGWQSLKVYDVLGKEIATLVDEIKEAGVHHSTFFTPNSTLPSGIYFYQLRAGSYVETKKMLLLR